MSEELEVILFVLHADGQGLPSRTEKVCKDINLVLLAISLALVQHFEQLRIEELHFFEAQIPQDDLLDVITARVAAHLVPPHKFVILFSLRLCEVSD